MRQSAVAGIKQSLSVYVTSHKHVILNEGLLALVSGLLSHRSTSPQTVSDFDSQTSPQTITDSDSPIHTLSPAMKSFSVRMLVCSRTVSRFLCWCSSVFNLTTSFCMLRIVRSMSYISRRCPSISSGRKQNEHSP